MGYNTSSFFRLGLSYHSRRISMLVMTYLYKLLLFLSQSIDTKESYKNDRTNSVKREKSIHFNVNLLVERSRLMAHPTLQESKWQNREV